MARFTLVALKRSVFMALMSSQLVWADIAADIDAIFSGIPDDGPGCSVGVAQDGEWLLKTGYGLANMELAVPLDGSHVHRMASVSKQFTAMAVLLLADEGKIDLDADVRDYLPRLKPYGARVTINAMLGHVSGMGDYDLVAGSYEGPKADNAIDLRSAAGGEFRLGNEDYLTIEEFYAVVEQLPLAQSPEQGFLYSNIAYVILAMLVEDVSGESLRDYAERRIFAPLGMHNSFFSDDPVEIVYQRADGYKKNDEGLYVNDMTNLFWVGDGGLHTNLDDMLIWDSHFYAPKLGRDPAKLMALMNTPNSEHRSDGRRYANGQNIRGSGKDRIFEHSGGWLGTSTYYARLPGRHLALAMMCNDASLDTDALIEQSMDRLLEID
ncbi:serine hydrolase domain-containing protein [Congregibacter litoralis]|uniref:Beta-lactamase class C and other penicillin binding protein n=1 Tax=Congregibacter litoralis KT71 TaxID=314285 RepID=A4A777_9GAMM|nr:serine hydrolase domain-containing protein [Congregibacter litoralis]EAQ98146.1 Beta-lactamase class C and other penicillin binding protein [Congregibacter litoralis KT71]